MPAPAGAPIDAFPVSLENTQEGRGRLAGFWVSALLHGGTLGLLILLAALAPELEENFIEVQLLKETPETPAPARRALAERRAVNFAPALQAVKPQIVSPRVVAAASPALKAEALDMDAVNAVTAPTQVDTSVTVVERVSAVASPIKARASRVDVVGARGPAVRGPTVIDGPVGASVGPKVVTAAKGTSIGTGKLVIGGGSSVREGVLSSRDVLGSATGEPLASVDTKVGDGLLAGPGTGDGTGSGAGALDTSCYQKPAVLEYLGKVQDRMLSRWNLPPGVSSDQLVTLRFRLDVAGSASNVSLVKSDNNALGASAIDALRAASPFPPMSEESRCLSRVPIVGTFSNPGAS